MMLQQPVHSVPLSLLLLQEHCNMLYSHALLHVTSCHKLMHAETSEITAKVTE